MTPAGSRPFRPRALSAKERSFTRHLIECVRVSEEERRKYLGELEAATVSGKCDCGCASIDFTIAGVPSDPAIPLEPFGEFISKDKRFGVFVFAKEGRLAGVEIYPLADMDLPAEFPNPDEFVSVEEGG